MQFKNTGNQASFSECGKYRWILTRDISQIRRTMIFIGLNPSRANSQYNDPTMLRLLGFCRKWGYGQLRVVNLFARVSITPSVLLKCKDPIGERNNQYLSKCLKEWSSYLHFDLWLGWGNSGSSFNRNQQVIELIYKYYKRRLLKSSNATGPMGLGLSRQGQPLHPLYRSYSERLMPIDYFKVI